MRRLVVVTAAVWMAGCGYIGDPLPPALNIVSRITDLHAVEYGDRLMITFTIPDQTTEQMPVKKLGEIDLRIGVGPDPFDMEGWARAAKKIAVNTTAPGAAQAQTPARDWLGKSVAIAVRVGNAKGRMSDWSNLAVVTVIEPVKVPDAVRAEPDAAGVKLSWRSAAEKTRVYRRLAAPDEKPALLETVEGGSYIDKGVELGKAYEYTLQALQQGAESEVTPPVAITPSDIFPPAAPAGLAIVPGIGSLELVWERNTEADLRGYRVYRAMDNSEFARIAEFVDTPAYSDRQVEAGKKYRYVVTALDVAGNESPRSAAVEMTAP